MVDIGIVGLGKIATHFHIPSLRRLGDVRIRALCARTAKRQGAALARSIGASFYATYDDMIASEKLDAVYLCSPTLYHCTMAVAALRRGIHVFCEKPIAMNAEEAGLMCREARQSGRLLVVGYNRRFSPTYQRVKRFSEQNRLNILLLEKALGAFIDVSKIAYGRRAAREAKVLGPEIMEFGVHFVDLAKWVSGKVVQCYFSRSTIPGVRGLHGNAVAVFDHQGGQRSILYFSVAGGRPTERSTAIADSSTCETFGGMYGTSRVVVTAGERVEEFQSSRDVLEAGGFFQEDRHFVDAVRANKPAPDRTADIIDTLELSLRWAGADSTGGADGRVGGKPGGA